jgi:TetR/AcrR family transcriptional regulator, regulator of cefoperazone and chloramphenicol sensitivity
MKTSGPSLATGARERLIEAAGEVFGDVGFHGATVREITKRAGVNLAAINYYFRDKEELYWAVLQHAIQCALKTDKECSEDAPGEEQLAAFIHQLLRNLLDPNRPDWHGKLISREMSAPTRMLDILVESNIRPRNEKLRCILRELAGIPLSDEQEALFCASVMSQCLYYRQNRPVVERLYPQLLKKKDTIAHLARHITEFSLAAIKGLTSTTFSTI